MRKSLLSDRKVLENNEVKAMDMRLEMKPEALQAILDEVSITDARAKKVQVQQLVDRRYLEKMEKIGLFETLWGSETIIEQIRWAEKA